MAQIDLPGYMMLSEREKGLLERFHGFFQAVGAVFGTLVENHDVEAFDFVIRGLVALGEATKEKMKANDAMTN